MFVFSVPMAVFTVCGNSEYAQKKKKKRKEKEKEKKKRLTFWIAYVVTTVTVI